jgi:transposase-like protein
MAKKLLEDEVQQICGERHERGEKRRASRHGHQRGWISISGQKVAIERPRVRAGEELVLDRYALMQRKEAMPEAALQRMVRGVSTRDYADVIDTARESFGIRRSSVSRAFIEASRREVEELLCARFDGVRFPAIFIDGVEYADTTMVVALGLTEDGQKRILGFREGASENAEVCKSLLDELCERGLCRDRATLLVLDGSKALC